MKPSDDLLILEEKLKKPCKRKRMRVAGKSVFTIAKVIRSRAKRKK